MKLKQQPEDFQVEELTDVQPEPQGAFAYYQLEKRGLGTPEAIEQVCRRWRIDARRISYGGLKDRHALTKQYLTIHHGPRRGLKQTNLVLRYLGQVAEAYGTSHVRANRFHIVVRDLDQPTLEKAVAASEEVRLDGVANYFDDQRFGSVTAGREFVARKLVEGDYEAALKLALAEPYEFDRAAQREAKRVLRKHWGNWPAAEGELRRGHIRNIVAYLADRPTDFRGAIARLPAEQKSLYLSAYQSWLWNGMLARWIKQHVRSEQLVFIELRLGRFPMCRQLDDEQRRILHQQALPLPSARLKIGADDPLKPTIDAVLREEGLELTRLRLKHFREPFFAKGERAAFFIPGNLEHHSETDDRHAGKEKLTLGFELPRGSYATMLLKRITQARPSRT